MPWGFEKLGGAFSLETRVQVLKSVTFVYAPKEDRILAAANVGTRPCVVVLVTRRWVLELLERAAELLARTYTCGPTSIRRHSRHVVRVRAR